MISFEKLWIILNEKKITQYDLIHIHDISTSTLHRLRKNEIVDTSTVERLCDILDCQPGDIMENLPKEMVREKIPSKRGRKKADNNKN